MTHPATTQHQPNDYHWSPANQRCFLEALSTTGNISESAKSVSMSAQAAYAFRTRAAGAVFKLGWDAAVLLARTRLEGELLERAIIGQEEIYERDADTGRVTRTRVHNGLSMAMLSRLDRMALGKADVPADTAMAQIVAQDFERYLDLIEADGGGAAAMLFLKARDGGLVPMVNLPAQEFANHYQLAEKSAVSEEVNQQEVSPETAVAEMHVWLCDTTHALRTNFPPPDDFDGNEGGRFGDSDYVRELTVEEEYIQKAINAAALRPLREAGEAARAAWFYLGAAPEPESGSEDGEATDSGTAIMTLGNGAAANAGLTAAFACG